MICLLRRYQKRVSNIIDDVLEWSPRLALSGMMEKQTVFNATDPNSNLTEGSKGSTGKVDPLDDIDGDTNLKQDEVEEVIENVEDGDDQRHDDESL